MTVPLKRICRQATRHVCQQIHKSSVGCQTLPESLQCQSIRLLSQSHRAYSQSTRTLAAQNQRFQGDDGLAPFEQDSLGDLPNESNISSTGHAELEQHRELREMVRLAAWEMPLLTGLTKPFQPPSEESPLRWRYTTYFGEPHPASNKVVVEFSVPQVAKVAEMTEGQQEKLKKLCGARYNPELNMVKMNCESFDSQAQNKRYLGDIIKKLIKEAKTGKDTFEDIPLDTRHHTYKKKLEFPEEWKLTPERKLQLEHQRRTLLLEEGKRVEERKVVSGLAAIEMAKQIKLQQVEEPVMAAVRHPLPKGKQGKKATGQTPR